jgi:hypothetical protein
MNIRAMALLLALCWSLTQLPGSARADVAEDEGTAPQGAVASAMRWFWVDESPAGSFASYQFFVMEFGTEEVTAASFTATVEANAVTTDHFIGQEIEGPQFADQTVWIDGLIPFDEATELRPLCLFVLDKTLLYSWIGMEFAANPRPLMEELATRFFDPADTRTANDLGDHLPTPDEMPAWLSVREEASYAYDENGDLIASATPVSGSPSDA